MHKKGYNHDLYLIQRRQFDPEEEKLDDDENMNALGSKRNRQRQDQQPTQQRDNRQQTGFKKKKDPFDTTFLKNFVKKP